MLVRRPTSFATPSPALSAPTQTYQFPSQRTVLHPAPTTKSSSRPEYAAHSSKDNPGSQERHKLAGDGAQAQPKPRQQWHVGGHNLRNRVGRGMREKQSSCERRQDRRRLMMTSPAPSTTPTHRSVHGRMHGVESKGQPLQFGRHALQGQLLSQAHRLNNLSIRGCMSLQVATTRMRI